MSPRAAIAILLLAGCGGGEGKPLRQGRSVEERQADSRDPSELRFWEGLADRAVADLAQQVSARGGAGRPVVRVEGLANGSGYKLDMDGLRLRVESSLIASGRFDVGADAEMHLQGVLSGRDGAACRIELTLRPTRGRGEVLRGVGEE